MLTKTCAECGQPSASAWCEEHAPKDRRPRPSRSAGYDAAWDRLSLKARTLQPWCSDCGTTEDLTADHLPSAWERKAAGRPVRLADVEVVCRSCNARRGAARPGSARSVGTLGGGGTATTPPESAPVAKFGPQGGASWR